MVSKNVQNILDIATLGLSIKVVTMALKIVKAKKKAKRIRLLK